jgi:5-methylcytosine-specific restriction protein A
MPAARVCNRPGCPNLTDIGQCTEHRRQARARRTADPDVFGYNTKAHALFRSAVLTKHPTCVECNARPATVADHWPISRRELITQHLNPDDPRYGRGLCAPCHNSQTAQHQPGGFRNT